MTIDSFLQCLSWQIFISNNVAMSYSQLSVLLEVRTTNASRWYLNHKWHTILLPSSSVYSAKWRFLCDTVETSLSVTASAVGKIFDYRPEGPGFIPRPGRGFNFWAIFFATPSMDRDVKPLVWSLNVLSVDLKNHSLLDESRAISVLWSVI